MYNAAILLVIAVSGKSFSEQLQQYKQDQVPLIKLAINADRICQFSLKSGD
jgi:hypothetical protein